MRWARTLMLADMLTKAIRANVAHEARPTASATPQPTKESTMGDADTSLNTTEATPQAAVVSTDATSTATAAPAPTSDAPTSETAASETVTPEAVAPATTAAAATSVAAPAATIDSSIDTRLKKIADLVQTLNENPKIHARLSTLLGADTADTSS